MRLAFDRPFWQCSLCMKTHTSKLVLLGSLLALACAFAAPAIRAADPTPTAPAADATHKEKKVSKKDLEKYDTNKDGKLDENEMAAMKADKAKIKAQHKADKAKAPAGEKQEK